MTRATPGAYRGRACGDLRCPRAVTRRALVRRYRRGASRRRVWLPAVYTKNWAVAEDLTSETFEAAFRKWRKFDPARHRARMAPRDRTHDRARLVPLRCSAAAARGACRRLRAAARHRKLVRRRAFHDSRRPSPRSVRANERSWRCGSCSIRRRGDRTPTRDFADRRLHAAQSGATKLEERMRDHDVVA